MSAILSRLAIIGATLVALAVQLDKLHDAVVGLR